MVWYGMVRMVWVRRGEDVRDGMLWYYVLPVSFCHECRSKYVPTGLQNLHVVSDFLLLIFFHKRIINNFAVILLQILKLSLIGRKLYLNFLGKSKQRGMS